MATPEPFDQLRRSPPAADLGPERLALATDAFALPRPLGVKDPVSMLGDWPLPAAFSQQYGGITKS